MEEHIELLYEVAIGVPPNEQAVCQTSPMEQVDTEIYEKYTHRKLRTMQIHGQYYKMQRTWVDPDIWGKSLVYLEFDYVQGSTWTKTGLKHV